MGTCSMTLAMTFQPPSGTGSFSAMTGMACTNAWSAVVATSIAASLPATFSACGGVANCQNCGISGVTAPTPTWQSSVDFCPLATGSATCAVAGQCAPAAAKICILAAGNQSCPTGFTASGGGGSWATGSTSAGAACVCRGCGVSSGESCANTTLTVGYGVCTPLMYSPPGSFLAGQFRGDGSSPPVQFPDPNDPIGGWLGTELFPALSGNPTAGVCAPSMTTSSGSYTATGTQTLCCL
jgi:hypothetical protein